MMAKDIQLPYPILLRQVDRDDGSVKWEARAIDLPGCIAVADTANAVLELMASAQKDWLDTAAKRGMAIPKPLGDEAHSGRISLRIPRFVHERASVLAKLAGVSLNAYISNMLSYGVGHDGRILSATDQTQTPAKVFCVSLAGETPSPLYASPARIPAQEGTYVERN